MKIKKILAYLSIPLAISAGLFCQGSAVTVSKQAAADALPANITFWSNYENDILALAISDRMDDSELLAQTLMFGWAGAEPSPLLNAWVTQRSLGSVNVFGWNTNNIQQVAKSVKQLQEEAQECRFKIPLFVATDQEGGWIRHVKGETSETPGNMAIGASGYPIDAYYSGYYLNREIKALGINMNFAPTVDLYTDLDSTVIGPRSFGSNPKNAGILGEAFAQGSMAAGVIPTAKHFPGHGDTSLDSHGRLPQINISKETLLNRELVPFKYLIQSGIPAIMSGHLSFPQIETDGTPASLSHYMLTDVLRGELGYEGLIITDDMQMNGATNFAGSFSRSVTLALEAGNDIIISSSTAGLNSALWTDNINRMQTVPEFRARIKDAAYRVILAKLNYFKGGNAAPLYPDSDTIYESIPDKEGQAFFMDQACRSITLYKKGSAYPLKPTDEDRVLIAGPFLSLYEEGRKRFPNADTFHYSYELADDQSNYSDWNAEGIENVARRYDTIIVTVYDWHTANIARRLQYLNKRVIVFSILSPVYVLDGFEWADTILFGYSYSPYSFAALWGALHGEFTPTGIVPLSITRSN